MKTRSLLPLLLLLLPWGLWAQENEGYQQQKLPFYSQFLGDSLILDLQLPETYAYAGPEQRYPIFVLFDSQHSHTYPHIIQSIDLLSAEAQMPECLLVGIPFPPEQRYYRTALQKRAGDSLGGIERMEQMLFAELFPFLRKQYRADSFVALVGHSRSAFLVNYLFYQRPEEIGLAVALSGFLDDVPLSPSAFAGRLRQVYERGTPFQYFATAGTSAEERPYFLQMQILDSLLSPAGAEVPWHFQSIPHANHLTNYWTALSLVLMEAFAPYNHLLNHWLQVYSPPADSLDPVLFFQQELAQAGAQLGLNLRPNLTQVYSLASLYAYQKEDYATGVRFIEMGLAYYPHYWPFYVDLIAFYQVLEVPEAVAHCREQLRQKAQHSDLAAEERAQILAYLAEN